MALGLGVAFGGCVESPKVSSEGDGGGSVVSLGGTAGSGGKIVLPLGGRATTGGAASAAGGAEGTLSVCDVAGGKSVGDPDGSWLIDDFDSGQNGFATNGLSGSWFGYTDGSPGEQVPTASAILPEPGGPTGEGHALHVRGQGFDSWGSGFVASLATSSGGEGCLFDASAYDGLTFWAKGEIGEDLGVGGAAYDAGQLLLLVIEKDVVPLSQGGNCEAAEGACWDSHRTRLTLDSCWRRYAVPFSELAQGGFGLAAGPLDLEELSTINFEVGRGNRYDVWIDELSFFVGSPPGSDEAICETGGQGGELNR